MEILGISEDQLKRAKELYPFEELEGSITKGDSNIFGAVGEIVVYDFLHSRGHKIDVNSTYDYDLIVDNLKVDIKTKKTTVRPRPNYFCSISAFNIHQKCDYYLFVRVTEDLSVAYLLGYVRKDKFYDLATFKEKGELDVNGFVFKDDCYNLEVHRLQKFKKLKLS
jgi:hypothetical protein